MQTDLYIHGANTSPPRVTASVVIISGDFQRFSPFTRGSPQIVMVLEVHFGLADLREWEYDNEVEKQF